MKFWFDFEFEDNGKTIDPISVGFVSEDGHEYYAEFIEYDKANSTEWLKANVFPWLCGASKPKHEIGRDLIAFLGDYPEIWGYYGSYDWVCLCQIYGSMMDLPARWPRFQLETMNYMPLGYVKPNRITAEHQALWDAKYQKKIWEDLVLKGYIV